MTRRWLCLALCSVVASLALGACGASRPDFTRPNGVAVAPDGSLYVMDMGHHRVVHLTATGLLLDAAGQLGAAPSDIYSGWDVALDDAGNIYFCNQIRDANGYVIHDGVKVFTPQGNFLRELGGQDYAADSTAQVRKVYGLDTDKQQRIYVADYGTDSVRVFDREGQQIAEFFGGSGIAYGEFDGLNDVAVDDQRGYLYAVDNVNSRVQQFRLALAETGALTVSHRLTFGGYGRGPGQFAYPQYVAVNDRNGRVYVGDMANRRIQFFDPDGVYGGEFSPPNVEDWQVLGLAVAEDGAVYAADAFNNAVWEFEADGQLRRRIGGEP